MIAAIEVDILCSSPVFVESLTSRLNFAGLSVLNQPPLTAPSDYRRILLAVGSGTPPLSEVCTGRRRAGVVYLSLEPTLRSLREALQLRADVILPPDCSERTLVWVLRALSRGERLPGPAEMLEALPLPPVHPGTRQIPMTERQLEIGCALAQGKSYQQIGGELFISPHTVEFHVRKLLAATKTTDRWMLSGWFNAPLPSSAFPICERPLATARPTNLPYSRQSYAIPIPAVIPKSPDYSRPE